MNHITKDCPNYSEKHDTVVKSMLSPGQICWECWGEWCHQESEHTHCTPWDPECENCKEEYEESGRVFMLTY